MILIDPPAWPAHGRLWSHLASDTSVVELHDFAAGQQIPRRAFESDHYDVPAERHDDLVSAGAVPVSSRDLLAALVAAGLRRPRRRGEEVVSSRVSVGYLPGAGRCRIDAIASPHPVPDAASLNGWWFLTRGERVRAVPSPDGWRLPGQPARLLVGTPLGYLRVRLLDEPPPGYAGPSPWIFHPVRRPAHEIAGQWRPLSDLEPALADDDIWLLIQRLAASG